MARIFIGIDPGQSGGIVVLDENGAPLTIQKMPETEKDLWELMTMIRSEPGEKRAFIERVWSSPQMGVVSAFKFGVGIGAIRMALTAAGIRYDEILPTRWQKAMDCRVGASRATLGSKGGDKNITKRRAQQLFPEVKVTHANSDALLLAEYLRRIATGYLTLGDAEAPLPAKPVKTALF